MTTILKIVAIVAAVTTLNNPAAHAQSTYIKIGTAKTKLPSFAMPKPIGTDANTTKQIQNYILNDLSFIDLFRIVPEAVFPQSTLNPTAKIDFQEWAKAGADYIVASELKSEPGKITLEIHLWQPASARELLAKRYVANASDYKTTAHMAANDIVGAITGKPGIFLTKIAAVCERTGKKELYTVDFDGGDPQQVTRHRSTVLSPGWSPKGAKLAYSVYNRHKGNIKNMDLFEFSFADKSIRLLSNREGINSGASYHPNGKQIALTMSFLGNPEIFLLDTATREASRLTNSLGLDVDPSISPDGSQLAFVSSRAGKPMLYVMPINNPAGAKRLTFAGDYNASPSWLPDSKKIVFAGWIDRHFDLFVMNSDGTKIERLTKGEGNNEDPSVSPDGRFVVFSSNRAGSKALYVMNIDSMVTKRISFNLGNCVAPKWSPYLQ